MSRYTYPKKGDKVWFEKRIAEGKQPNGYILRMIYEDREVSVILVKFQSGGVLRGGDVIEVDYDDFDYYDKITNIWMFYEES